MFFLALRDGGVLLVAGEAEINVIIGLHRLAHFVVFLIRLLTGDSILGGVEHLLVRVAVLETIFFLGILLLGVGQLLLHVVDEVVTPGIVVVPRVFILVLDSFGGTRLLLCVRCGRGELLLRV